MKELSTSRPIVVGIDGSTAAIHAALWAVDEAVSRDVPLRLVCAVEQCNTQDAERDATARTLASAETAIRRATKAIEATGHAVKIETEIAEGPSLGSSDPRVGISGDGVRRRAWITPLSSGPDGFHRCGSGHFGTVPCGDYSRAPRTARAAPA